MTSLEDQLLKENEQKKSIALKMLQDGVCCSAIAKYTGLSKEEIRNLDLSHECNH